MTKIHVTADYVASTEATIELPGGKTWKDVERWYVKWGEFVAQFKDGTSMECEIGDFDVAIDWKRPSAVRVRPVKADGQPDWDNMLSEDN
jgi:hypothetical protein